MKKRKKQMLQRTVTLTLTASMLASYIPMAKLDVQAQYVSGNAPFINSWLVSGPYETAVADEIYNSVIPENPNLAKNAKTSASSATLAANPTTYLIDGSTGKQWVTEGKENPCWAQLEWDNPITVGCMSIALWQDGRHINKWYDLTFTFADGTTSEPVRVECTSDKAAEPTLYTPKTALQNVKSVKIEVDKGLSPYPSITGISEVEVYQYALDGAVAATAETEENVALNAEATASSVWQNGAYDYPDKTDSPSGKVKPESAIDGDLSTEWISQMHDTLGDPSEWPKWDPEPTFKLNWDNPVKVNRFVLYDRYNTAWPADTSNVEKVNYVLKDASGKELQKGSIEGFTNEGKDGLEFKLPETVAGVASADFKIIYDGKKNTHNVGLGFREVEVYGSQEEGGSGEPSAKITPELGESMVEGGQKWEYFDDRIWNRTYDDYQDLYGYYGVKKGVDTKNKYVYAHTYVYSPKEQKVQIRVGTSGENRLYVNDKAITTNSKPVEVQKDQVKKTVTLKEGWNKVLIQMKHTYTDDKNANGVPIAKDQDVYYLGFYGRITDESGNEIEGLQYSVTGTDKDLAITTGGLSADDVVADGKMGRGLPENVLPIGYTEWPYVWNESQYKDAQRNIEASAFQFMADGGQPGYTWEIVKGTLPEGLTLNEDGTIDGFIECDPGDYKFTVQVTDDAKKTAKKDFSITVKERPNKWFEEGRVSALSHTGPVYQYFVDPNFSADLWAERASRQGHSMVSVEALQQNYYWPSRFADPKHPRNEYLPKDENGQVVDGLKQFEEAVKRYGIKFGLYYATEGGGLQHYSTDVFLQNVEDLILRYEPAYLYFDGPQTMGGANYDVMYSNVRNYSDEIIIDANVWGSEYGDPDIRTGECSGIYARERGSKLTKRTVMEPWKSLHTKNNYTPYYARRDDYRFVAQEMVMNAGRGMVDNNDQMPIMSRGTNWDSPEDVATRYPKSFQEFVDVREETAAWFAPEGKSERHESTTGTMPYFLNGSGCDCKDDGKDNLDHFEEAHGPKWGYATYRDNNIYLHIMKGPDKRTGFDAIEGGKLNIDPIKDKVKKVIWLNEDKELKFKQNGEGLSIDLSGVEEDQVDTIIKVVTDNETRDYKLTNVVAEGKQLTPDSLQVNVEGYMTYQALKANLEKVTFASADSSVAAVDKKGVVTAKNNGTTTISVSGTYEGVTKEDSLKVTVKDGKVYVSEEMIGASLWVEDRISYGEFSHAENISYRLEGRSEKGGAIGLDAANVTMKCGIVDLAGGDKYTPVKIEESDLISFKDGTLSSKQVSKTTRAAVWAEVELDGKTFTTNRVYMDIHPYNNLTPNAKVKASDSLKGYEAENVADGQLIKGTDFDASKWSVDGKAASSLTFDLKAACDVQNVEVNFNSRSQNYYNTPKTMEIQVSEDGKEWTTVKAVTPPTGGAYFGFSDVYAFDTVKTQYVRLNFPEGSNGNTLDILEVAINGTDLSNRLAKIEVAGENISETTAKLNVTGFNGMDKEMDLTNAETVITSLNPEVIAVNENNELVAVAEGRTGIQVQVSLDGAIVETIIYADVTADGKLYFGDYLEKVNVTLDQKTVSVGDPIAVQVEGILNTGKAADMSGAEVEYIFSENAPVAKMEGADVIYMPSEIGQDQDVTVQVKVTVNGATVVSSPVRFKAQSTNISAKADVMVSSVRDRNGVPDGNNQDDRYLGVKAIDGDLATSWAAKQADKSPWIQFTYAEEEEIGKVVMVERGHDVNACVESLLEFFDKDGTLVHSQKVTDMKWDGQPENVVELETPVKAAKVKITIDPDVKYHQGGSERGFAEVQIVKVQNVTNKIEAIQNVYVETEAGTVPELPEKVTAVYSDLTTGEVAVTWDKVKPSDVKNPGVVRVEGVVEGSDVKAVAQIKVLEKEETVTPADKTLLQKTYDYALTLTTDEVVDSAVKAFEAAKAEAKAVLDNPDATQEEVNAAWNELLEGIWGLGIVRGDKTNLGLLIDRAEAMMAEKDRYVQKNWKQLVDALDAAKKVMDDEDALEEDVQKAAGDLLNAILAQRYKANKDNLQNIIDKAEGLDLSKYTKESVAALKKALKDAKAVMADKNLSEDDQKTVDKAAKDLAKAIEGLKLASGDNGNGGNDNNGGSNNSGNKPADKKPDAPTTGDNGNFAVWFVLAAASCVVVIRRRKTQK